MPHRFETPRTPRLTGRLNRRSRVGLACLSPLCLVNLAATGSLATTTLSNGGSPWHGVAGCAGLALAVAGLFWGAERAGWRPGWRPSLLATVLTALALTSLGVAGLTGFQLSGGGDVGPAVLRLHEQMATLALFIVPLSLLVAIQLRLGSRGHLTAGAASGLGVR